MIVPTGWISGLRCCECSSVALVTIAPGDNGAFGPGDILVRREAPIRGWCLRCAQRHGWLNDQQEAA